MLSRAIGQVVVGLKDAPALEARRAQGRQQERKVLKDKVVRSEKRHHRERTASSSTPRERALMARSRGDGRGAVVTALRTTRHSGRRGRGIAGVATELLQWGMPVLQVHQDRQGIAGVATSCSSSGRSVLQVHQAQWVFGGAAYKGCRRRAYGGLPALVSVGWNSSSRPLGASSTLCC
jgi:hypothetical protein